MRRDAGSRSPDQLCMFQNVFNNAALIAMSTTAAVFVALAVAGNEAGSIKPREADLLRVTVIHKNQLRPRLSEVEARASERHTKGEANSVHRIAADQLGQWI
jgi:hypothetical protein